MLVWGLSLQIDYLWQFVGTLSHWLNPGMCKADDISSIGLIKFKAGGQFSVWPSLLQVTIPQLRRLLDVALQQSPYLSSDGYLLL
jgi:hypothetical protein